MYQWSVQEPLSPQLATGVDHWCSLSVLFLFSLAPNFGVFNNNNNNITPRQHSSDSYTVFLLTTQLSGDFTEFRAHASTVVSIYGAKTTRAFNDYARGMLVEKSGSRN